MGLLLIWLRTSPWIRRWSLPAARALRSGGSLRRIEAAMEPKGWLTGLIHRARSRYFRYTSDRIGAANVEWRQQRNWKVVDPTVLIPGILSKIRPRNCPNQSYVRCVTTAATRQASVAEGPGALQPIPMESRHATPPDDPTTWGAFGTVHLCLPFLRTSRREGSQAGWRQGNLNWHPSIK